METYSMEWKPKQKYYPETGDIRTKIRFAWFPVQLDNGNMLWLERYICKQEYCYEPGWEDMIFYWKTISRSRYEP